MKTRLGPRLSAVLVMTAAAGVVAAAPASADGTNGPLCLILSNAYQYDQPLGTYERTVHAGNNFRVHGFRYDSRNRLWAYGHSGESWWDDGYILDSHLSPLC
jgi:hypothetical protein